MKRSAFVLIVFCIGICTVKGQSTTQSFDAGGIKVIFKPTPKNIINIRMYFRGGVTNYAADKAGIEDITLDALTRCGTTRYDKNAFRDTSDKYGISLYGKSTYDYGYVEVNCVSKYLNKGWDLFSEAIMNPVFDADELKLLKENAIASYRNYQASPENRIEDLQMQNAFANTPYAINPRGNEQTLAGFTADDLGKYYKTLLNKERMFIVVVGNISKQELFEKILLAFGNIPSRRYTPVSIQIPDWTDNKLLTEKSSTSTNYISAIMNAPEFTSISYVPFRLGITGLGGNISSYLYVERNLSYAAGTAVFPLRVPYASMFATAKQVPEVMAGLVIKLRELRQYGFNEEWLQHLKNRYIALNYFKDQSASAISHNLGEAEILGNWHYAENMPQLVNMVTVEQVNNALSQYIIGLRWNFLGNLEAVDGLRPPVY